MINTIVYNVMDATSGSIKNVLALLRNNMNYYRKHVEIAGVSQKRSEISRSLQDKIPVEFPWALVL